jgi:RP/EB family microtubule-associated protein
VNGLLSISLTKVEQCASGAVYCQIVDSCHAGTVKMSKLNWMAKTDHEFIPNYKILQAAFDKNSISKHIDVDKLIRAKYQDNLEFLQWMKCYWEHEGSSARDYDPVKAREGRPVPPWAKPLVAPAPLRAEPHGEKENVSTNRESGTLPGQKFEPSARKVAPGVAGVGAPVPKARGAAVGPRSPKPAAKPDVATPSQAEQELKLKVAEQQEAIDEMGVTVDGLEQERDYYFKKLRRIEILCENLHAKTDETLDAAEIIKDVQNILYAEMEDAEPENAEVQGAPIVS